MKAKDPDPYHVAIHEAGHAVAILAFKHNLIHISQMPGEKSLAHAKHKVRKSAIKAIETGLLTPSVYQYIKELLIINIAGQAALAKLLKEPFHQEGSGADLRDFVYLAYEVFVDRKVVNAYLDYIIEEARFFVSKANNWKVIKAIAKALMLKKTLSKKECMALYNSVIRN